MPRETSTFLGFPFDSELFTQMWTEEPDPVLTAMIDSGAMVHDALIQSRIQNDGNLFTIPFYNVLDGDPSNYDGQTDISVTPVGAKAQSGVVFGRSKGFVARDFQGELSGSDPMTHIGSTVGKYWHKQRQKIMIGISNALFNVPDTTPYSEQFAAEHVMVRSSPIAETTINSLMVQALGDNKTQFSLAVMHSKVAETLEKLQVLEFWKQTLDNGVQRPMNIASVNGLTAIIDDGVPYTAGGEYTTYIFGNGALRNARGRVDVPSAAQRDEEKNGGQETLYTRLRETIHPNGFSFIVPDDEWSESPTDSQLFNGNNWKVIYDPKAIAIAKLVTNESAVSGASISLAMAKKTPAKAVPAEE
ncbi:MAG: coat protein [Oscillospiraceae bacterium]|nr:coat protein [Oscillospiraceae bacterium]